MGLQGRYGFELPAESATPVLVYQLRCGPTST